MSLETQSYEFHQDIQADPEQIFFALSNASALKEWMCDVATLSPKAGGRIYLAWNSGFYAAGEFTVFEPDHRLVFTWFGRSEPAPTLVEITLTPEKDHTSVKVIHSGLGSGEVWEKMIDEVKEGWPSSLENLASVLESGPDLRFILRPMLGINGGDFNKEIAAHLEVPVFEGLRLDGVLETMGAFAAGLRKDDVIITMDSQPIRDYESLAKVLSSHRAGDKLEVEFYRGPEKNVTLLELSRRPIPEIPSDIPGLVGEIKLRYAGLLSRLDEILNGVSEAEADFKPGAEVWNVKEILTHLIHGERDGQTSLTEIVGSQVRWADDFAGNLPMRTRATLHALPTLIDLRAELERLFDETIALYENLPPDLPEKRKGAWWGIAYYAVEPPYHEFGHFEQIEEALRAARS